MWKKRKEKTTPFGVNLTRSQVVYRAAEHMWKLTHQTAADLASTSKVQIVQTL